MAFLFKPTWTQPVPATAERVTVEVEGVPTPCVRWRQRGGRVMTAPVLADDPGRCRVVSEVWYVGYTDHRGKLARERAFADRRASERKLVEVRTRTDRIVSGDASPATAQRAGKSVTELLDEWAGWVEANGATARHAALFRARVGLLAERLRWAGVADLGAARVTRELGRLRAGDGGRRPISPGTSNHYVTACRAFGAWLRHAGYADADPFADLAKLDKPAKSVERRALTAGEFARLLAATRARTHSQAAVSGPDRAVLYLVAAYTGFRYSELLSLTPESFHLTGHEPFVRLAPAAAKNRTGVDQPLLAAVSDEVRPWLAGRSRGRPVWTRASHSRAAEIMRADLEAAGLPFETSEGRFDFHALRVQYITALALAGVDLATAQKLARHSTPVLTANVYTRLKPEALHNATAKLSPPPTTATGG